jgi:hypothetical protein
MLGPMGLPAAGLLHPKSAGRFKEGFPIPDN